VKSHSCDQKRKKNSLDSQNEKINHFVFGIIVNLANHQLLENQAKRSECGCHYYESATELGLIGDCHEICGRNPQN
jgi:hypothetical protein